jgi:hypothetical protein
MATIPSLHNPLQKKKSQCSEIPMSILAETPKSSLLYCSNPLQQKSPYSEIPMSILAEL